MTVGNPRVKRVEVSVFEIPTEGGPESDATLVWDKTTMVLVQCRAGGQTGLGYSYTHRSAAAVIESSLTEQVVGFDAMAIPAALRRMLVAIRNFGRPGITASAIAAVDISLWDLKAKLLDVSLAELLGIVRARVPAYASGGFTSTRSTDALQRELAAHVARGFDAVKIKIGRYPREERERLRAAREAIGPDVALYVDANGVFTPKRALLVADELAAHGVTWFEEPVSSDDVAGLRLVRDRAPPGIDIAAGEYAYGGADLGRLLDAQAVDVLQVDASRALGVSGFLTADALCAARSLPLSAHTIPAVHAHLGAAAPSLRHVEYFYDHARIEDMLFEGAPRLEAGELAFDRSRPGLGLELREREARRFRLSS